MPYFRLTGLTVKKGRSTSKTSVAETTNEARKVAERHGIQVQAIERPPSEPASQAQLS